MNIIGFFNGIDPAACLVRDGVLDSFVEEERLIRFKHAANMFPVRSIDFCLKNAGLTIEDIDCIAFGWDLEKYSNGEMAAFYEDVNKVYPPDGRTLGWQRALLSTFNRDTVTEKVRSELVRFFGTNNIPPIKSYPHHKSHAVTAFHLSPFEESLVCTIDGSGDTQCATIWAGKGGDLELVHEVNIPHSLGWYYAAITEFLGFQAYDGEYKVMGLAAYGRPNSQFAEALAKMVPVAENGWEYTVDPKYIHHGPHTYSSRFTDHLADLLEMQPRFGTQALEPVHEDLAFEAQKLLEDRVVRLLRHFRKETGIRNVCLAGGVALNVKMNRAIRDSELFDDMFVFPIPSDSGTSIGAALGVHHEETGKRAAPISNLYLGPGYSDEEIEQQVRSCGLDYRTADNLAEEAAELIAGGKVVGWFQGRMESGPRALGGRSILADPRRVESRDRVNVAIKFREYWRPFCPSMLEEAAHDFLDATGPAPFMIEAFDATDHAKERAPAIVHVDQTVRVQTVDEKSNPRYRALIKAFEAKTGVPVLLNTSFNIKGEAIVCSPRDALRTFWSTGIDALVIGNCILEKPVKPLDLDPEDVIR